MDQSAKISIQAEGWIQRFIFDLKMSEELIPKTLKQYASDLRQFGEWVESGGGHNRERERLFDPAQITTATIIDYREYLQTVCLLKPATVNRKLIAVKRFFKWAARKNVVPIDISKPVDYL